MPPGPPQAAPPTPPPSGRPPAGYPAAVNPELSYFNLLNRYEPGFSRPLSPSPSNDTTYASSSDQRTHADWVADRVTKLRMGVKGGMGGGRGGGGRGGGGWAGSQGSNEENERIDNIERLGEYIDMETTASRDERRRYERLLGKPSSPALDALEKLKGLQKTCVQSMASLRVVKAQVLGEDEGAARFVPLQQVVDAQAKKIMELERKLESGRVAEMEVVPAQVEYVKELEKAYASMEDELNFLQKTMQDDRESYKELVNLHEKERLRSEKLTSKNGMLQGYASQLQSRVDLTGSRRSEATPPYVTSLPLASTPIQRCNASSLATRFARPYVTLLPPASTPILTL